MKVPRTLYVQRVADGRAWLRAQPKTRREIWPRATRCALVWLGYTVESAFRRQGFAEEAILRMIDWAHTQSISRFIVSVGPTNGPSLALAAKLGFKEVTRVVDEEDGPEIVLELRT